ncbi:MAG: M20/M25/M40 family metallo-hydrolase [Allosphingosinicella sp.]|uniref:M20/M25/M40 family metallo-hydrolase n=1 Tax=Allosphingosinicella sp. TaxID=2823234 RepID=UPI00394B997E
MNQPEHQQPRVLDYVDRELEPSLGRLFELLRIPSISTDPEFAGDCRRAARLLADELADLGFSSRVADTEGHPMVVAHHEGRGPHILFYGHYDVQPVDPLDLWRRDPFDPVIEERGDGSRYIVGRGASDDKGQLRTFVEACRAWKETTGELPCSVTIFLEGEEESASPSLDPFLRANRDELAADFALICDTTMWDRDTPALTMGLRGTAAGEVRIKAAARDLHSGLYGGPARNPIQLLCEILASLKDADGRVTLDGFYDGVGPVPEEMKASWARLGFDEEAFLGEVGLSEPAGERGQPVLDQCWARPTADINGISGGYTGDGFKTVIPSEAFAKLSFRLVGEQDPKKVWASFERHVRDRLPADCTATFWERGGSRAISLDSDSDEVRSVRSALRAEWGTEAALLGCGGSIPVVHSIREILGLESVLVGFALNDDQIHSPNEKYELKSFHKGIRSWVRILGELGGTRVHQSAGETEPAL